MKRVAVVLYEDSRAKDARSYGPHNFVLACVADEVGADRWELRDAIYGVAKRGAQRVLATAADDLGRWTASGETLFAVLDSDQPPRQLPERVDCVPALVEAIREQYQLDPAVRLRLIERNTETIVEAAAKALGRSTPPKDPLQRDSVLMAAAAGDPRVRAEVRSGVPSLDRLVKRLVEVLSGQREE